MQPSILLEADGPISRDFWISRLYNFIFTSLPMATPATWVRTTGQGHRGAMPHCGYGFMGTTLEMTRRATRTSGDLATRRKKSYTLHMFLILPPLSGNI